MWIIINENCTRHSGNGLSINASTFKSYFIHLTCVKYIFREILSANVQS